MNTFLDPFCDSKCPVGLPGRRRAFSSRVLIAFFASLACLSPHAPAQVFNDPGFGTELVATLPAYTPVGLAWSPDGRMFVWEKNGVVRIVKNVNNNWVLLPTPFIDLSSQVNTYDDRGMWGLTFHPDFVNNGYVYLGYVYENAGNPNDTSPKTSRMVRVTANPANPDVALAGSLVVILSGLPADSGSHDIGTLKFAPDGKLFVGNGDGADANFVDPNSLRAQDLNSWSGKILRINPDGTAPGDNPFDDGTDSIRSKVWCYGLRNPYRFSLHPTTGLPYMGDVGWHTWEEVNKGIPGANYGWPFYEGNNPQSSYQSAFGPGPSPSSVTAPLFTYDHSLGSAVILGPFYTGTAYPASYQGSLFFGDYSGNWIRRVVFDASGNATSFPYFATNVLAPVSIEQGPDGMLYYLSFTTGEIRRIRYNGPIAVASATPTYGPSPLTVSFSSAGSVDTGGGALSYSWTFGDGGTSSLPNPSHTYLASSPTPFTATLTVRNSLNLTSTATTKVTVGSVPPVPTILTPANGTGFMPGQTVTYQGSATDAEDGVLPPNSLSWTVLLHHNTHVHTFVGGSGSQGSFVIENHGPIGSFSYEILLTATDSSGLAASTSVSVAIIPDTTPPAAPTGLGATATSGTQINLSWTAATDNAGVDSYLVERQGGGSTSFVQVAAVSGTTYSDSGLTPATTYSYRVRASDASGNLGPYSNVATATTSNPGPAGLVAAYSFGEGSGTTVADASGNGNTGTIQGATWTTQGKYGSALSFNGTSNLVAINGSSTLNVSSAMTLEAWIFPTASQSGWRTIMQRQVDAYFLNASNSSGPLRPSGGGTIGGSVPFVSGPTANPVNAWTHVALTYNGSTLQLYVNGNLAASGAASGPIETNSNPLRIGGNVPWGEFFQGRIDEVRVYNRALTQAEIQTDMNTPVGGTSPNTPPTISSISNQTTTVGTAAGPIGFTVGDAETAAGSLTLSGSSSNTTLVPNANIAFGGSGANRTVTVTPAAGQTGTATITVTVSDGTATASTSFVLTVNGTSNTPPTISSIGNQTTPVNTAVGPISFTVGDAETAPGSLTLSGSSLNTTLVPNVNIAFGGSGANRTVTVTPAAGQTGTAAITVTVSDGTATASTSFVLTVSGASNTPPTISSIGNQTTPVNTAVGPISFTVGDAETAPGSLTLSGGSSNTTLVPNANIVFGGSGASRTITVTPAPGQTGTATIAVTVSDGTAAASTSFVLTVTGSGPAGLVAAYSFNAGAGTTLADVSGNGNTGTIQGATWTTAAQGKYGSALNFNGTSNLVTINGSSSLNLSSAMTLEAWIYPTASQSGWRTIMQRQVDTYFLNASNDSGPLRPAGGGSFGGTVSFVSGPTASPTNTWTHVALTYDGVTLRLYRNGTQVASAPVSGGIETNSNALRIGGNVPYGEYFRGRIDEARVYNRALSQAEIQADMNAPLTP